MNSRYTDRKGMVAEHGCSVTFLFVLYNSICFMEKKGVEYHENQEQCCGNVRDKQLQPLSGKHCDLKADACIPMECVEAGC